MLKYELDRISNLITDTTLRGAAPEELERTIQYSMDISDCIKSKKKNDIDALENKYLLKED